MLIVDPVTGESRAPGPGELFKNPTLAATFRSVAKHGKAGFYEGRIAEAIVERNYIFVSSSITFFAADSILFISHSV